MAGNYDNSAGFYDRLSWLVYGDVLVRAQVYLLPHIPQNAAILIVGGGTGWILEEISKLHPSGLKITYVEISARMTALSRKRNTANNIVEFINMPVEQFSPADNFDVIITPFLFDNYTDQALPATFGHIHGMLKPGGLWINTDFQLTGRWWQYVLLKSMLLFFKVLCGVESWHLPDIDKQFTGKGYQLIQQKTFYNKFIITKLFIKQ